MNKDVSRMGGFIEARKRGILLKRSVLFLLCSTINTTRTPLWLNTGLLDEQSATSHLLRDTDTNSRGHEWYVEIIKYYIEDYLNVTH